MKTLYDVLGAQKTLYEILGVEEDVSREGVNEAFRKMRKIYHPDRNLGFEKEATELFKLLQEARDILMDSGKRARYDAALRQEREARRVASAWKGAAPREEPPKEHPKATPREEPPKERPKATPREEPPKEHPKATPREEAPKEHPKATPREEAPKEHPKATPQDNTRRAAYGYQRKKPYNYSRAARENRKTYGDSTYTTGGGTPSPGWTRSSYNPVPEPRVQWTLGEGIRTVIRAIWRFYARIFSKSCLGGLVLVFLTFYFLSGVLSFIRNSFFTPVVSFLKHPAGWQENSGGRTPEEVYQSALQCVQSAKTRDDRVNIARMYRQAAGCGHAKAQYAFACCYKEGFGVVRDPGQALVWYLKAAKQGVAEAQYEAGLCYADGLGTPRNSKEAFRWFKEAAYQGHVTARYRLGRCYYEGKGTSQDWREARRWLSKVPSTMFPDAPRLLQECNRHL